MLARHLAPLLVIVPLAAQSPVGGTVRSATDPATSPTPRAAAATEPRPESSPAPLDAPPAEPPHRRDGRAPLPFRLELALGGGNFEHETAGQPLLDDEVDGGYARIAFEYRGDENFGLGLRLEGSGSDDDLFLASGGSPAEASDGELFLHGTGFFGGDAIEVPLRFGLSLRGYTLDDPTGADLSFASIGPRLEVEPDFRLLENDSCRWSLYARLGAFVGYTAIETDPATEDWTTTMTGLDYGVGTRLRFEHVELGIGWLARTHHADESDTVGGTFVREFDARFSGLEISVAARF